MLVNARLDAEQRDFRQEVVDFARSELRHDLLERDRSATFSRENWARCAEFGIVGSHVPARYGGRGRGAMQTVIALEALGYASRDNALGLALGGQIWSVQEPIVAFGTEAQKQKYLPRLCSGEHIGAHGVTEPSSGSDALSLKTTATATDGGYVLDGRKSFIGMAPVADLALVLARTDPSLGSWGVSVFLVETDAEGVTRMPARPKMGARSNPLGDLVLENVFVPTENRLGDEGLGMSLFTRAIGWERAFIHAGHIGSMDALLEKCVAHAAERTQFGRPIGEFQAVSHRIAKMKIRQETARMWLYRLAAMKDEGVPAELECSMAKVEIAESLVESSMDAVRVFGARGYVEEYEVERELRDSVGGVIYAGTSEIQLNLIARYLGL